jgi:myo-inositol-1(or 4)-monophosphatase
VPSESARFDALAGIATDVCRSAAEIVRRSAGHSIELGRKTSPSDVVTQTDVDAEHHIRTRLQQLSPHSTVIGEENGVSGALDDDVVWIVDPLDGTVNFTYGLPVVAVSIAAAVDGRVVAGTVVDVVHRELFSAALGSGATVDGRSLHGSSCGSLADALVTTGFSYASDLRRDQGSIVAALLPVARDIRCFGSAALQMCWVAAGRVDAYFERDTKLWDYSAAALIASEAGMVVELPCPENVGLCVTAPPAIFDRLRQIVEYGTAA